MIKYDFFDQINPTNIKKVSTQKNRVPIQPQTKNQAAYARSGPFFKKCKKSCFEVNNRERLFPKVCRGGREYYTLGFGVVWICLL